MSRVYAIDPSLTSTGVALIDDTPLDLGSAGTWSRFDVHVIRSTGKRGDTIVQRSERITRLAEGVRRYAYPLFTGDGWRKPDLIVIEGPSHGSVGGSMWDRAGLWWLIVAGLPEEKIAIVPPQTRAKWVTGKGNADKAAVANVVGKLCPDVQIDNSDQADALALALMGAHALGMRPDLDRVYRNEALLKVQWPADVAARLLEPYEQLVEQEALT